MGVKVSGIRQKLPLLANFSHGNKQMLNRLIVSYKSLAFSFLKKEEKTKALQAHVRKRKNKINDKIMKFAQKSENSFVDLSLLALKKYMLKYFIK